MSMRDEGKDGEEARETDEFTETNMEGGLQGENGVRDTWEQ